MNRGKMLTLLLMLGLLNTAPALVYAEEPSKNTMNERFPSFADLVEELLPSVVNISTQMKAASDSKKTEIEDVSPEFKRFFGKDDQQEALGSGFIIDETGYILTNNHVINDADSINVTLWNNTQAQARVIGKDDKTDIALIKIETAQNLTPIKFGDSDKVRVGDWILAIGNPFGLGGSVTAGIVSAKSRDIESGQYDNFIQTDASINQGSSGGPMFNMSGEVIGINSAIFSSNGASMGIGFAIPSNLAQWVAEQLKQNGKIIRGWLGLKIQPLEEEISGLSGGVLVSDVSVGGPAEKSGIKAGDIIYSYNNKAVQNTKEFSRRVAESKIGSEGKIGVWRNGQKRDVNIVIENQESQEKTKTGLRVEIKKTEANGYEIPEIGMTLAKITPELIQRYELPPQSNGMVITEIQAGREAEKKGLKVGNIIVKIDKKDVPTIEQVKEYLDEAKMEHHRPILIFFQDKDSLHFATLKLKQG